MEIIPLFIFEEGKELTDATAFMDEEELKKKEKELPDNIATSTITTVNRFLSGFYLVDSFKIIYDFEKGKNVCEFRLSRREWGVPKDSEVI